MSEAKLKSHLLEMDLYKLLDCEETSTVEQIKKAYRKKALEVHPDKNRHNKEAAEKAFIELGKAFEILADKSARAAYDAARKAKKEKALRDSQMDAKRRELKEKLEANEKAARERTEQQAEKTRQERAEQAFFNEIERVRRENRRLLEEENNKIAEEIRQEKLKRAAAHHHEHHHHHHHHHTATASKQEEEHSGASYRVKVTWPPAMSEKLTQKALEEIFSKYGHVENLILGAKATKPTALLEFRSRQETKACINDGSALNEQYSIQVKCLDNLESPKRQPDVVVIESSGLDQEETNNGDGESFEDMEARILKKMKSSKK